MEGSSLIVAVGFGGQSDKASFYTNQGHVLHLLTLFYWLFPAAGDELFSSKALRH